MTREQLEAQLAILDQLLASARKAREERTTAWYVAEFNRQQAERTTSVTVIHPEQAAA